MAVTEEIREAAQELGRYLQADPDVAEYLNLKEKSLRDAQALDLEQKYDLLYQRLIANQQNNETLGHAEVEEYYTLKYQVDSHPLIAARESQMEMVKAVFADAAQRMTFILGIDYTTLVQ